MELKTKHFGTVAYEKEDTVHFANGIYGFEDKMNFLPIAFQPESDAMISLQSIDDEYLAFVLMNPFNLIKDYAPMLQSSDYEDLGTSNRNDLSFYVICAAKENASQSTVNLKCPIVVNALTRQAKQVILESSEYGFRHKLTDLRQKGAKKC